MDKTTILVKNLETIVCVSPSPMLIWGFLQWSQVLQSMHSSTLGRERADHSENKSVRSKSLFHRFVTSIIAMHELWPTEIVYNNKIAFVPGRDFLSTLAVKAEQGQTRNKWTKPVKNDTEKEAVKAGFLVIFPSLEFFCKKSFNETKSNVIFLSFIFRQRKWNSWDQFFLQMAYQVCFFFLIFGMNMNIDCSSCYVNLTV